MIEQVVDRFAKRARRWVAAAHGFGPAFELLHQGAGALLAEGLACFMGEGALVCDLFDGIDELEELDGAGCLGFSVKQGDEAAAGVGEAADFDGIGGFAVEGSVEHVGGVGEDVSFAAGEVEPWAGGSVGGLGVAHGDVAAVADVEPEGAEADVGFDVPPRSNGVVLLGACGTSWGRGG